MRYKISMEIIESYVLYVDANSKEQAWDIGTDTDVSEWESVQTETLHYDVKEVQHD